MFHSPPQYMTNSTHSCCHCKSSSSFTNLCAPLQQDLKQWKTRLFSDNGCLSLCMCVCVCACARAWTGPNRSHLRSLLCCVLLSFPTDLPPKPIDTYGALPSCLAIQGPSPRHFSLLVTCWSRNPLQVTRTWHTQTHIPTHRHTYLHTDTHTHRHTPSVSIQHT